MDNSTLQPDVASIVQHLVAATEQVAPNWPLDQMIAVNPYWPLRRQPIAEVAAQLQLTSQIQLLPSVAESLSAFSRGEIGAFALDQALQEAGQPTDLQRFILQSQNSSEVKAAALSWLSQHDRLLAAAQLPWQPELLSHVSQFCAWYFQQIEQGSITALDGDLFAQYHAFTAADLGLDLLLSAPGLHRCYAALPTEITALVGQAAELLQLPASQWAWYAQALVRQLNGWASWIAYQRWQADLAGQPERPRWLLDLPAILLGWELALLRYLQRTAPALLNQLRANWWSVLANTPQRLQLITQRQQIRWIWWRAAEIQYQQQLLVQLNTSRPASHLPPLLQAVFCIDVRSEVFRRALEQQHPRIQTIGFAGFFGLPIEFQVAGTALSRPQLPGLLAPVMTATASTPASGLLRDALRRGYWQRSKKSALWSFPAIESAGWLALPDLLAQSLLPQRQPDIFGEASQQPLWQLSQQGRVLSVPEQAALAAKVLRLMGLTQPAPTVLLVGHASQSNNNLHAACLDCGACGGQSGEVNVRMLAALLNDPAVRTALQAMDIHIPPVTRFVPAIHQTTTDQLICFDTIAPAVESWLARASELTQAERQQRDKRAAAVSAAALNWQLTVRAGDWSETRPEWGLANNAALVIAPRSWTRAADFAGRVFLHDYDEQADVDGSTLELLLTAPLVVTNWINMQYNASVTEPRVFGSGNKVLHNAVADRLGVFEGQGGDLRIGLPWQSVHDGERLMHQPLRLTAVVAASPAAIEAVLNKHPDIKALADHGWLHLWQWQQGQSPAAWQGAAAGSSRWRSLA